ncbi:unnamed protein product, partial [Rotaria magnacalcarata]
LYPNDRAFENDLRNKFLPNNTEYHVTVVTGTPNGAGTDSRVYITLFSDDGKRTEKLQLQ